jgi:hypothetical protein
VGGARFSVVKKPGGGFHNPPPQVKHSLLLRLDYTRRSSIALKS